MKSWFLLIFLPSLVHYSLSDVLLPTTVAECQRCCDIASTGGFSSFIFTNSVCKDSGCNRITSSNNQLCSDLFTTLNSNNRRGCELGRDFRFNGYTSLLTSASDLRRCPSLPGEQHFLTDGLLIPHTLPSVVSPFAVTTSECSACCEDLRTTEDGGTNGKPDDFQTASCQTTCTTSPVAACFAQTSHNIRSGCLLAMDFLLQGQGTLDVTRGPFTCNATGAALIPGTSFPTVSPTKSPTKNPTKKPTFAPTKSPTTSAPTKNPTKQPTFAPTKSPTTSAPTRNPIQPSRNPTRSPTRKPTRPTLSPTLHPTKSPIIPTIFADPGPNSSDQPNSQQSPTAAITYAIAGAGGLGVLLSCCLVFFVLGRRSSIRRSKTEVDALKRAIGELEELKSAMVNSARPSAVGSFDPANFVADARELSEPGSRGISEYLSVSSPTPTSPKPMTRPKKSEFAPPGLGYRPDSLAIDSAIPEIPFRSDDNYKADTIRYKLQSVSLVNGGNTVIDPEEVEVDESELDPVLQLGPKAKNLRPYFDNAGDVGFTFGRKVVQQSKTPAIAMNTLDAEEPPPPPPSVVPRAGARNVSVYGNSRRPSIMRLAEEAEKQGRPKPKISF